MYTLVFYTCVYRNLWLQSLEQNIGTTKTPADNLLFELNIKMCTVGILCTLLRDCELGSVLSVLHHPGNCNNIFSLIVKIQNFLYIISNISLLEPVVIVKHPSDGMECNSLEVSVGQHLCLSCKATGIPPPSYQWCHNNIDLQEQQSHELDIVINR